MTQILYLYVSLSFSLYIYIDINYLIDQNEGRLFFLSFLAAFDCCFISFGCKWAGTELCRVIFSSSLGVVELILFCTFAEFCHQNRDESGIPRSMSGFKEEMPPLLPWV